MIHQKFVAVCVLGWVAVGCAVQAEGTTEGNVSDAKPEDGSEFAGNQFGAVEQAHALHYTDGTNLWQEPGYPMGKDNPNCKDWYMYDRWRSNRPPVGSSSFSTFDTTHNWAQGATINNWMAMIPNDIALGYNDGYRAILVDHNSVVARSNGRCSGRYVFQMDNHTNYDFAANHYFFSATIPYWTMPRKKPACTASLATSVPAIMVDLYVCEAPSAAAVGGSIGSWCALGSGHWRMVGGAVGGGVWNTAWNRCDVATGVEYKPPFGKVAVSFNMVIKAGIGHGVAPADIQILRYN
jgi:hypothetical protein